MKIKLFILLITLLLAVSLSAAPPTEKTNFLPDRLLKPAIIDNTTYINANRIMMFVTNHGNFGRDLGGTFGYDYGTWFPYTSIADIIAGKEKSPYYAGGLWVGAVDSATQQIRVTVAEYSDEYVPGPMSDSTFETDRPDFRVYKLYKDSLASNPNQDYTDYIQYAIDQGAPYKLDLDGNKIPDLKGDQFCWSVYNDANPAQHDNQAGDAAPLGLEVKGSVFAFDQQGSLGNIVFLKWRVFNKGNNTLQNCFISVWNDPDLGGAGDDLVGCDTTLSVGYIYNSTNNDQYYDGTPPCLGIDFFQGPLRARTAGDTLPDGQPLPDGRMWGNTYPDSVNIGMYSFSKYINGTDPRSSGESYNNMLGLNKDGSPFTYQGRTLRYMYSGDPVSDTGDLDFAPADRRMMLTTGPITFRPGDSTEILAAMVIGQGTDRLNSITVMKTLDAYAQKVYENDFNPPSAPAKPIVTIAQLPGEITLSWTDTSEVDQGGYDFEGYTVWQSPDGASNWKELATYDLINDRVDALVDTIVDTTGLTFPVVKRRITNSGLVHYYTATIDGVQGGSLNDLTSYFFRVSAFSFDYIARDGSPVPNGDRFLESQTTVTVIPRAPVAGLHPEVASAETLLVTHAGPSDGSVAPIIKDPTILTGHTYRAVFEENNPAGIANGNPAGVVWHLIDTFSGDTLLKNQIDMTGSETYRVVDGILVKVMGPPLEGKDYSYTAPTPPIISPVVLHDNPSYAGNERWFTGEPTNGGELLFGAVFMEPNFYGLTSVGPTEYPIAEIRFRPMQSYTDLTGDGRYTIGEPYVVDSAALTQKAFVYSAFGDGSSYRGFLDVPFTAWDVTDASSPRQLNVVFRDRDKDNQWDPNFLADVVANPSDTLLPNGGDLRNNYIWILTTTYDPTGTHYGNGSGGTVDFFGYSDGNGVYDAAWALWLYPRLKADGSDFRGVLAEECTLTLIPPILNLAVDTFTFTAPAPTRTTTVSDLDKITAVPNPFYLYGSYDANPGSNLMKFHHLPAVCKISIYNLAGDLIRIIDKNDPSPIAGWDLLTTNSLPVASGIYIYVVDAPGFGQKVGKVAVFTESEVLKIY